MFCKVFKDVGKFITAKPKINYVKNVNVVEAEELPPVLEAEEEVEEEVEPELPPVLEAVGVVGLDYDSDDDDEEEIIRQQEILRLKLEKKRQKKLQENKAEEWEEKKEPLIMSAIHNDMKKLVELAKKNNIPLTLLSMGLDLTEDNAEIAYQLYEQEQMDTDYPQVKHEFFTPTRTTTDVKTDVKTKVKTDVKTDVKTKVKTDVKTKVKTKVKTASKRDTPMRVTDGTRDPTKIMTSGEKLRFTYREIDYHFTYVGNNQFEYKGNIYRGLNKTVVTIQALENTGLRKNAWNVWTNVQIFRDGQFISVDRLPIIN
jgi:hypothetical protein